MRAMLPVGWEAVLAQAILGGLGSVLPEALTIRAWQSPLRHKGRRATGISFNPLSIFPRPARVPAVNLRYTCGGFFVLAAAVAGVERFFATSAGVTFLAPGRGLWSIQLSGFRPFGGIWSPLAPAFTSRPRAASSQA